MYILLVCNVSFVIPGIFVQLKQSPDTMTSFTHKRLIKHLVTRSINWDAFIGKIFVWDIPVISTGTVCLTYIDIGMRTKISFLINITTRL